MQSCCKACQPTVRTDHTVAGDKEQEWVFIAGIAHSAGCLGLLDLRSNLAVSTGLPVRDIGQCRPHRLLKGCALHKVWYSELQPLSDSIFLQLGDALFNHRTGFCSIACAIRHRRDTRTVAFDANWTEGQGVLDSIDHRSITTFSMPCCSNSFRYSRIRSVRAGFSSSNGPYRFRSRRASSSARISKNMASS